MTGGVGMFDNLTTTSITTEATTMAGNFDSPMLVAIGIGIAFACVRFVVGLFY